MIYFELLGKGPLGRISRRIYGTEPISVVARCMSLLTNAANDTTTSPSTAQYGSLNAPSPLSLVRGLLKSNAIVPLDVFLDRWRSGGWILAFGKAYDWSTNEKKRQKQTLPKMQIVDKAILPRWDRSYISRRPNYLNAFNHFRQLLLSSLYYQFRCPNARSLSCSTCTKIRHRLNKCKGS